MSKHPPIPDDQKGPHDRRDEATNVQTGQPGDADVNLDQQGRFANVRQNLTPQHKTQAR
jgi:hypothetical protein